MHKRWLSSTPIKVLMMAVKSSFCVIIDFYDQKESNAIQEILMVISSVIVAPTVIMINIIVTLVNCRLEYF